MKIRGPIVTLGAVAALGGALVLGAYIDRKGRRAGLILTLALMSVGTISIACLPGYAAIGIFAPLLVVLGRLVQGFSAGVELGGSALNAGGAGSGGTVSCLIP